MTKIKQRIRIINGESKEFADRLRQLELLYGDTTRLTALDRIYLAYKPGLDGGMLVSIFPDENAGQAQILLCAFPKADQRQGHATDLLAALRRFLAKKGVEINVVELDMMDSNQTPWIRMGFRYEDRLNLAPVMCTKPMAQFLKFRRSEGGITFEDMQRLFGNDLFND